MVTKHFTIKDITYKINNLIDLDKIKKRILNLKDPYNRSDVKLKKVKIDKTFPKYIFENTDKLSDYIA